MMDEKVIAELERGEESDFHKNLLKHVKDLVDMSRTTMNDFYQKWDTYNDVYRGHRYPDKTDLEARKKQEPEKMVVPLAFAQIQTFVAFCILLFTQKEEVVELIALGPEDEPAAKVGEALLARDLRVNNFVNKLRQFLTDIARFSVGVFKHTWSRETELVRPTQPVEGSGMVMETQKQEVVKFLGNRIENVSPYRFYPDVRLPLSRFQEGEFCASEDEVTITELKRQQKDGKVAGVKNIQGWSEIDLAERLNRSRLFWSSKQGAQKPGQSKGSCVLTEAQVWICPKDFILDSGEPLGPEDYPILYVISYVNDKTIIRVEPMNYVHNQFTYDVAEFSSDMHSLVNVSLSEIMDMLQTTISWFLNAHISSVRRIIQNRLIIDPSGIELEDLKQDRPYIRLNMSATGGDVRRFVQQLQVTDVTTNHVADAQALNEMLMTVTGISENSLGQYAPGRRSATEARNVNFNASSRLKIIAQCIYYSALEPLFRKMLSNLRDGLDTETYVRVRGMKANPTEFQSFKVTRDQLVGDFDFAIFDATLPSEKGYMAQQIGEMLTSMMASPEAVPMFGYDPRKLFDKMFELRGVRHTENLKLDPTMMAALQQQNAQPTTPDAAAGAGAGAPLPPEQQGIQGAPMFAGV